MRKESDGLSGFFGAVGNGDPSAARKERELLESHRYLLSPAVDAQRYTSKGLAAALQESVALLASPAGPLHQP